MSALLHPPPITPLGPIAAATQLWRSRGALHLTVVVKATFTLVPEGRMSLSEPDAIARGEEADRSGIGLRTGGDLVPYTGQPEVWLTGHAEIPPGFAQPTLHVQLAVVQGGALRIDKQLDLETPELPAARVRIAGMGPIARDWPLRSRWLEGLDARGLDAPLAEIPEGLHWEYFQTAPLDQRLDPLRGDEWLVLGGMFLRRPRLRTQLPEASAAARIYRVSEALPRVGEPLALRAEAIQIDTDRQRCCLLYRGYTALRGEAEIASLHVVAGLELPGQALIFADPFLRKTPSPLPSMAGSFAAEVPFSGTVGLSDDLVARLAERLALPFEAAAPTAAAAMETPFDGTMALPHDLAQKLAAAVATPFEARPEPRMEGEVPFSGTAALPPDLALRLAAAMATPFEKAKDIPRPAPPPAPPISAAETPFSGTLALPDDLAERLAHAAATPFEPPHDQPEPPTQRAEELGLVQLSGWPGEAFAPAERPSPPLPPIITAPPDMPSPPGPHALPEEPELLLDEADLVLEEEGLGAAFLAAMSAAGEAV
jgi:hypothetical protein